MDNTNKAERPGHNDNSDAAEFKPVYLIPDLTVQEPGLSGPDGILLLHLPFGAYVLLQDSLPGFMPMLPGEFCGDITSSTKYSYDEHQAMSVALGDFNGDGFRDVVLLGRDQHRGHLVALISTQDDYSLVREGRSWPLQESPCLEVFLEYWPRNDMEEYLEKEGKTRPIRDVDGFIMIGAVVSPYWTGYRFQDREFVVVGYSD